MNIRQAVNQACEELGTRTSLETLQRRVLALCGHAARSTIYVYRLQYRKENKVKNVDCRTYDGQPRRNMLNDNEATLPQVKRIKHLLSLKRVLPESILNLLGDGKDAFHSLEQLKNAVNELIELRAAA